MKTRSVLSVLFIIMLIFSTPLVVFAHGGDENPPHQGPPQSTLRIVNNSNYVIHGVLISPVVDDNWGYNWLGTGETIAPNSTREFSVSPDAYDILIYQNVTGTNMRGDVLGERWDYDMIDPNGVYEIVVDSVSVQVVNTTDVEICGLAYSYMDGSAEFWSSNRLAIASSIVPLAPGESRVIYADRGHLLTFYAYTQCSDKGATLVAIFQSEYFDDSQVNSLVIDNPVPSVSTPAPSPVPTAPRLAILTVVNNYDSDSICDIFLFYPNTDTLGYYYPLWDDYSIQYLGAYPFTVTSGMWDVCAVGCVTGSSLCERITIPESGIIWTINSLPYYQ